ncbi:hypothetical protein [Synergistes jonesii]|uniref:Uncharacterized protein n=1 Tax=Synergistes jonesii TaxID=2754 RepID=A0A073IP25_9BACT|nr:hypothetical protein [Synergistes jonesii]KEJ92098.1 hypothetical protein EH55_05590 [Synergistes jonesii]OFB60651.1 hypothetical protein JS72_12905 [Synergistes jonesii]OFB62325.1 hypothetical protein JS73_07715 [Synergistes jonesii]OFB63022.1 hypothetical protein JS79_08235 [Synergistes jonesii]OFB67525.1 hypothetical protein JS78_07720 [Synergistes jonesii]
MTLQEGAEKYLSPINDDKKYAEQKRRLFKEFWKEKSEEFRKYEIKSPEDIANITKVRKVVVNSYVNSPDFEARLRMRNAINSTIFLTLSIKNGKASSRCA